MTPLSVNFDPLLELVYSWLLVFKCEALESVTIIDCPHLFAFNAKTQFLSQVSSKLLIYLGCNVNLPLKNVGRVPQHIRRRIVGCWMRGNAPDDRQLGIPKQYADGGKGSVCWKTQGEIGKTSGDVYGILKLQLFWCDPESIKCTEICYFTLIFGK